MREKEREKDDLSGETDPVALTRNPANEVMNPSFVNSHIPPYSSSSICWKLLKYKYVMPALTTTNLKYKHMAVRSVTL